MTKTANVRTSATDPKCVLLAKGNCRDTTGLAKALGTTKNGMTSATNGACKLATATDCVNAGNLS